jgi:hypothetical protein
MSIVTHLTELERKHQVLDQKLSDELARPSKDDTRIAKIKRQKLLLKDQITRLRRVTAPQSNAMH